MKLANSFSRKIWEGESKGGEDREERDIKWKKNTRQLRHSQNAAKIGLKNTTNALTELDVRIIAMIAATNAVRRTKQIVGSRDLLLFKAQQLIQIQIC